MLFNWKKHTHTDNINKEKMTRKNNIITIISMTNKVPKMTNIGTFKVNFDVLPTVAVCRAIWLSWASSLGAGRTSRGRKRQMDDSTGPKGRQKKQNKEPQSEARKQTPV